MHWAFKLKLLVLKITLLIIVLGGVQAFAGDGGSAGSSASSWQKAITATDGSLSELEIVIPFYEGVEVNYPTETLKEIGQTHLRLAYPGVLSLPMFAWRFGQGQWTAVYAPTIGPSPAELKITPDASSLNVEFRSFAGASFETLTVDGGLRALAAALKNKWKVAAPSRPLAPRFAKVNFYVHQWVSSDREPALQLDWTIAELARQMKTEHSDAIQFVYGFDPSGVDLGGRYFWSQGATGNVRQVLEANPQVSFLNWLNLRTYKRAIPRLGIELPVTREVKSMLKQYPGTRITKDQFAFKSLDMCLASAGWQSSRLREFDRLVKMGFKVIQIDEFPIPSFWHTVACQSRRHLHKPNDIVDEWRHIDRFLGQLAARARKKKVFLTCEEPSGVMVPYVSGYIDRMFNDSIDLYSMWRKNANTPPTPFFSLIFGDRVTPYTDADEAEPARQPPPGWLKQHKLYAKRPN